MHTCDSEYATSVNGCRSCGKSPLKPQRRYCSAGCARDLKRQLGIAQILLRVVRTRYAAVRWTATEVVLQVVPYQSQECFGFVYPRSDSEKPSNALRKLTEELGRVWQQIFKVSRSRFRASQGVLQQASQKTKASTFPSLVKIEAVVRNVPPEQLAVLCLRPGSLRGSKWQERLRKAYRAQVMLTHPDRGGRAQAFIAVRKAFAEIKERARLDSKEHYGVLDAWLYDGNRKTWRAPLI